MKKYKFLIILILVNISLLANVTIHSSNSFTKGEAFIFQFEAIGSSVKFPKIEKIEDFMVEDLGTSRSLQIINGNYDEKISKKYKIVPNRNFIIPSFTFLIDSKEVKSPSKKIYMQKMSKTKSGKFDLSLHPSKKNLYVGEELLVKLIFKYKRGLQITNLGFEQPHFENFWYKKIDNSSKSYEKNGFVVQELDFLLFPQKSGKLTIDPLRVDVQIMDSTSSSAFGYFSASPKLVKIYSNQLKFEVKDLPEDVTLIGDFDIQSTVDRIKVKQGEAISYKININGIGNFDDIQDIELQVQNATIYDNKPEIKTSFSNKVYKGTYSKVYSIVPNISTTIPSFEFKYFNKDKNRVITKKTKAFKIEVENEVIKKVLLEKPQELVTPKKSIIVEEKTSFEDKILFFVFGVITTLLIIGLSSYVKLKRIKRAKNDTPLIKLVKNKNNKEDLMKVLAPYVKRNQDLDELIFQCEDNKDFKILKKEIIKLLKEIKI